MNLQASAGSVQVAVEARRWPAGPRDRPPVRASRALLGAVVLLAASGLMFELTLTRVFSATIWYHYTFVAISVALLGWGLGGFGVYLLGLARQERRVRPILMTLSLLLAVALPAFPCVILRFPFTPELLNLYFVLSIGPFLLGGAALSLAFESHGTDVNRLYFADLVGAAGGVLLVPLLIGWLGAETTVMAAGVLPALAAVLLGLSGGPGGRRGWTVAGVLVLAAAVGVVAWNHQTQTLTIRDAPDKALYKLLRARPAARIVSDHWNAYSRITTVENFDERHAARLFIDSDAETSVLPWDGTPEGVEEGGDWFRAFPLRLTARPNVLVIGPGGGTDVVLSVAAGAPRVTAVEMNPLVVRSVRQFGQRAGDLYDHPQVRLVVEEGRNFIRRTDERFDAIILGFVDSWASVASGGLSLTENYLYTREAIEAYYDHLTDAGALTVIRWPSDVPRLVANCVDFLTDRGLSTSEIGLRIVAASRPQGARPNDPPETVFMLSRAPLSAEAVDRLLAGHADAKVIWAPHRPSAEPYAALFAGHLSFERYQDSFEQLATPVNDDHPFFFAIDKPVGIPGFAVRLLALPAGAVVGFTILLVIAGKVLRFRAPGGRALAYFGALGVGFIIVEVALIQRLILLLGHPIYTLVVILFTLLLAGGLGSFFARRFAVDRIRSALGWILAGVVALVLFAAYGLPALVQAAIPWEANARIVAAAAMVFPFGFLMGMPFPLGLRRLAADPQAAPVSSLWGINGVASVIGSIAGMMIAVAAGFTWAFLAGAVCYAVAHAARPR